MPETTLPHTVYLTVEKARVVEADEELRIGGIRVAGSRHRHRAAHVRLGVELSLEVGIFRAAGSGPVRAAGLRHEAVDDAVKDDAVVEAFVDQPLDVRDMAGRDRRVHLDDHRAFGGLERQRVSGRAQIALLCA